MFCWRIFFEICWRGKIHIVFQWNVSMKWLYTNIWRWTDIAKFVWTPTRGKFHPAQQTSAICFRSEEEKRAELLLSLTANWEPRSSHSICHPWNLACPCNSPMPVTQKPHQPVCRHRVGWQKPSQEGQPHCTQQQSLAYSAKIPCRSHAMGEEVHLSPKAITEAGERHTS